MKSFEERVLALLVEGLEQPRCASSRLRIDAEIRKLIQGEPNACLKIRSARAEVVARTDFFDLIIEIRHNGLLLGNSEWVLSETRSLLAQDYFITWLLT